MPPWSRWITMPRFFLSLSASWQGTFTVVSADYTDFKRRMARQSRLNLRGLMASEIHSDRMGGLKMTLRWSVCLAERNVR